MSMIETYFVRYLHCKENNMDKVWYDKCYLLISGLGRLIT